MTLIPLKSPFWGFERTPYTVARYHKVHMDQYPDDGDESEDEWGKSEARWGWEWENQRAVQLDSGPFLPPNISTCRHTKERYEALVAEYCDSDTKELKKEKHVDLARDYKHRGLQVIVKLANIELSPDKPKYKGGAWHVEGQLVCSISTGSLQPSFLSRTILFHPKYPLVILSDLDIVSEVFKYHQYCQVIRKQGILGFAVQRPSFLLIY